MADERVPRTYKFSPRTAAAIDDLAERWHIDKLGIVAHGVELLADPSLAASHGGGYQAIEQALRCWAEQVDRAAREVAAIFGREEWNLMADVNNGCSPLFNVGSTGLIPMAVGMIQANVADGHALDGAGLKWLDNDPKRADKAVAELCKKLASLTFVQGWAVVVALQVFWEQSEQIDHTTDEWWTIDFRRRLFGVPDRKL